MLFQGRTAQQIALSLGCIQSTSRKQRTFEKFPPYPAFVRGKENTNTDEALYLTLVYNIVLNFFITLLSLLITFLIITLSGLRSRSPHCTGFQSKKQRQQWQLVIFLYLFTGFGQKSIGTKNYVAFLVYKDTIKLVYFYSLLKLFVPRLLYKNIKKYNITLFIILRSDSTFPCQFRLIYAYPACSMSVVIFPLDGGVVRQYAGRGCVLDVFIFHSLFTIFYTKTCERARFDRSGEWRPIFEVICFGVRLKLYSCLW